MTPFARLADFAQAAERWLLPAECLLCQQPISSAEGDPLICGLCRSRWRALPEPLCERCGQPVITGMDCRLCLEWPPGILRVRSAVWLDEGARLATHQLKYEGWARVAEAMALPMRPLEPLRRGQVLVPVPLAARRRRNRGYNQSEEIAQALSRLVELPVSSALLRRVRDTRTQTRLTPEARQANLAQAFKAAGEAAGQHIVLVDDVFTTGATLVAAASALVEAGAASVEAVTFARAREVVG